MTIWILVGHDGKPFKGHGWRAQWSGNVKAYDNQKSANIAAGQFKGVLVREIEVPA